MTREREFFKFVPLYLTWVILLFTLAPKHHLLASKFNPRCSYQVNTIITRELYPTYPVDSYTSITAACSGNNGEYFFFDDASKKLWKVKNGVISLHAGSSNVFTTTKISPPAIIGVEAPAIYSELDTVRSCGVAANGDMYIVEQYKILKISSNGTMYDFAGKGSTNSGGASSEYNTQSSNIVINPFYTSIAVAPNGDVYFSDSNMGIIRKISASTKYVTLITGSYKSGEISPQFLSYNSASGELVFLSQLDIKKYSISQNILSTVTTLTGKTIQSLLVTNNGDIYYSVLLANVYYQVKKIASGGTSSVDFIGASTGSRFNLVINGEEATSKMLDLAPTLIFPSTSQSSIYVVGRNSILRAEKGLLYTETLFTDTPKVTNIRRNVDRVFIDPNTLSTYLLTSEFIYQLRRGASSYTVLLKFDPNGVAYLEDKTSLLFHSSGDVILVTSPNLRRITAAGVVTTIAGSGQECPATVGGSLCNDGLSPATKSSIAVSKAVILNDDIIFFGNGRLRIYKNSTNLVSAYSKNCIGNPDIVNQEIINTCLAPVIDMAVNPVTKEIYLLEYRNYYAIRKIDTQSIVREYIPYIATCVKATNCGDGGVLSDLALDVYTILKIQFSNSGDLYIFGSNPATYTRIRKITPNGQISTVIGPSNPSFTDITDSIIQETKLYAFASNLTNFRARSMEISPSGDIYLNYATLTQGVFGKTPQIAKFDPDSKKLSLFTGTKYQREDENTEPLKTPLLKPISAFQEPKGDIYYFELLFFKIRKYSKKLNMVSTLIDDIPTITTNINNYPCLYVKDDYLYYSDNSKCLLKQYSLTTGNIETIAGKTCVTEEPSPNQLAKNANLRPITCIFITKSNDIYLCQPTSIKKISADGVISVVAGFLTGTAPPFIDNVPAIGANTEPFSIHVTDNQDIYIGEKSGSRIRYIDHVSGNISTIVGTGTACNDLSNCGDGGSPLSSVITGPVSLIVTEDGTIVFGDYLSSVIRYIDRNRREINVLTGIPNWYGATYYSPQVGIDGGLLSKPVGLQFTGSSILFVENGAGTIRSIDQSFISNGYSGFSCVPNCYNVLGSNLSVCSSHGECIDFNNCLCDEKYFGYNCQVTTCNSTFSNISKVCHGRGSCDLYETCNCRPNYFGKYCENTNCYGINSDNSSVCSSQGNCIDYNYCSCNLNYYGHNCDVTKCNSTFSNTSTVCNGRGSCDSYETCNCRPNYFGKYCEYTYCFGLVSNDTNACSAHGSCIDHNSCECSNHYFGACCNETTCNSTRSAENFVCNGRGSCDSYETCNCRTNYFGKYCENTNCYGKQSNSSIVCSSHGSCVDYDTCACNENYYGPNCSVPLCFTIPADNGTVCSGNGICFAPNTCSCASGYYGMNCSEYSCFNISSFVSNVCSARGLCVSPDKCSCENYFGSRCHISKCFGVLSNDSNVCSGMGECIDTNTCVCSGAFGENCELHSCFGIASNNSQVCSGNGNCEGRDICNCISSNESQVYYSGKMCETLNCYSKTSTDTSVCTGHGHCFLDSRTLTGGCNCSERYYGRECEYFTCYGKPNSDPTICNGKGNCTDVNTCKCYQSLTTGFWEGIECTSCSKNYRSESTGCSTPFCDPVSTCNNRGKCNATDQCECSGNFAGEYCLDCKNNFYGSSCEKFCLDNFTCNGKGHCNQNAECECFNNDLNGHFMGQECSWCTYEYFGSQCLSTFTKPVKFLDNFKGVKFSISGSFWLSTNVDCSKLIVGNGSLLLGYSPKCYWSSKSTGEFTILFGSSSTLLPNDTLLINTNAFENTNTTNQLERIVHFVVQTADSPIKPVAIITGSGQLSICDDIVLDGSGSFSGDMRPLNYIWSAVTSPDSSLSSTVLPSTPRITISSNASQIAGRYRFSLKVQNLISGQLSDPYIFTVEKQSVPVPSISIIPININPIYSSSSLLLKKLISFPACYYSNQTMNVNWDLINGPPVEMTIDFNQNLFISRFTSRSTESYTFMVNTTSTFNLESKSSTTITFTTAPKPLSLSLYSDTITQSSALIIASFTDPDSLKEQETWNWSCTQLEDNLPCGSVINNTLKSYSSLRNSSILLPFDGYENNPTLRISLSISKGIRKAEAHVEFSIPASNISPPTISLISQSPQKSYILRQSDIVNIALDVSANNERTNIDQYITRTWSIDGVNLISNDPIISSMSTPIELANSIIINPSTLTEGNTYSLTLKVSDKRIPEKVAQFTSTFTIARTPQPCPCSVYPSVGNVFDTSFLFSCTNCQNSENSIQITYGFVDDKTKIEIPLYTGTSSYSTKLPSSNSPINQNNLQVFFKIVDESSGAFILQKSNVKIELPVLNTLTLVTQKASTWTKYSKTIPNESPNKMVFNTATISRVFKALYALLGSRGQTRSSKSVTVCNNGNLNSNTGKCICLPGYYKTDCSMSQEMYNAFLQMRLDLLDGLISDFQGRNPLEMISESYLSSQAIIIDSLVENFDEINNEIFIQCLGMFRELMLQSVSNSDLTLSDSLSTVLASIVKSLYSFIQFNEINSKHEMIILEIMNNIASLRLRAKFVGEIDVKLSNDMLTLVTNKHYLSNLPKLAVSNSNSIVVLPADANQYFSKTRNPIIYKTISSPIRNFFPLISETAFNSSLTNGTISNETRIITTVDILSSKISFEIGNVNSMNNVEFHIQPNSPLNLTTEIMKNTTENGNFTVIETISKTYSFSCIRIDKNNSLIFQDKCQLIINSGSNPICICNILSYDYVLVRKSTEKREIVATTVLYKNITTNSETSNIPPPTQPQTSQSTITLPNIINRKESVDIVVIIVPIIGGTIVLITIIILIALLAALFRKCKKPQEPTKSFELQTV